MAFWDAWTWNDDWNKPLLNAGVALGSGYMASKAAQQSTDSQNQAANLAWERSQPWNTGGVFGASTFDPTTRTSLQTLSPEFQAQFDASMSSAAANRAQADAMGTDPMAMGKQFYDQQKALYAPEQEQQRLGMENRLLGQGMFGSSGGGIQMNALLDAQQQQDAAAQIAGYDKAQAIQDIYRARYANDLALAQGMGNLPGTYSQTGMGIGANLSGIAGTAGNMQASAAKQTSDANAGMWGGFAGAVNSYVNPAKKTT